MGITGDAPHRRVAPKGPRPPAGDDEWLSRVAQGASHDAGDVSADLLGDYLLMLAEAATSGRRPTRSEVAVVRLLGRRAAETGVSAGHGVNLYLSAARRVWDELPAVVRERNGAAVRAAAEALLQVVEDAVAAFAEGHAEAGRELVRREETLRRDLIDDLLRGCSSGRACRSGRAVRAGPDSCTPGRVGKTRAAPVLNRCRDQCVGTCRPRSFRRP